MITIKKIKTDQSSEIKQIFQSLEGLHCNIFKDKSWKIWHFECKPFIDEDLYPLISKIVDMTNNGMYMIEYPIQPDQSFLFFKKMPAYQKFVSIQQKFYLNFTGGVAYDTTLQWGIHSDADNSILTIGIEENILSIDINKLINSSSYLITKEKLISEYGYLD